LQCPYRGLDEAEWEEIMKFNNIRSIVDMIRDGGEADLIIVSLFVLPVLLGTWSICLSSLGLSDQRDCWRLAILAVVFGTYAVGLVVMKWWDPPNEKLRRANLRVKHLLQHRKRASYAAIREEISEDYSDAFLKKLLDKSPETFRTVKVKRGNKYVPGITLVEDEVADTSSAD